MASIERIPLHDVTLSCAVEGDPKAPLVIAAHGFPDTHDHLLANALQRGLGIP